MIIGLNLSCAPVKAASTNVQLPALYFSTANSMISMAFLAARPTSVTIATWK